ncbi:DUF4296 domain-containing protein [Aquimarina sp. U1-2]|uniref:DUF4296 domain-containing protein n=1 Tax=Aquimarina sp. U1-2 TaxID=2823141 RepID=UPI001AEC840C|nr:DUF4296 domain-containing protein [Aquimarina sp. U1-2]MBP2831420.1 DUF4296 domain-containing protein [Aquimarina sp. U1-2]
MMKKYTFLLIFIVAFSCQTLDKPQKPEILLGEDKMVAILSDLAFVKAAKTSFRKVLETKHINPETYILQKHHIDSAVFAQNNAWYTHQQEAYEHILTQVKSNLEASKAKYEAIKKEEDSIKKVQDSVKKAKDSLQTTLRTKNKK